MMFTAALCFSRKINMRPDRSVDQFRIVHAVNNRPLCSYNIKIFEQQKANLSKPLGVIYEWTDNGYKSGLE